MVSKLLVTEQDGVPPQITFAHFNSAVFSPTAANDLRVAGDTEVDLYLLDLADAAAVQSAKADLGEKRAVEYNVRACIEMQVAVADPGSVVEVLWSPSQHATAANGNSGGCSGVVGAYTGYSADLELAKDQLIQIGFMSMTDDAVPSIQTGEVGILRTTERYGQLVLINRTGEIICDTDDIEAHVVFDPIIPESQ